MLSVVGVAVKKNLDFKARECPVGLRRQVMLQQVAVINSP